MAAFCSPASSRKDAAMLKDKTSSAIVAVTDADAARDFYQNTLGLELLNEGMGGVMVFRTGSTQLLVYPSEFAGTNKANAVVWDVGDEIDEIVKTLKDKGVTFKHYPDNEWMKRDGDIHVSGGMKLVWFKDPDGNILHLNKM
jgi:catechol 2,3-dioxygenase-like lactoylglutathione lyase family enzyme